MEALYQDLKDTGIGFRLVEIHTSGSAQAWNEELLGGAAEHIIAETPPEKGEKMVWPPGGGIYYPSTKILGKGAVVVGKGIDGSFLYNRREEIEALLAE